MWVSDAARQREAILAALEQMLAWPEISRSPQLSKFLDYIVRRTLAGDEQSIKAYSIAVDVLGRSADFDPQADPIVRVQARRLRGLIEGYYRGPGKDDPVRISLPVGRYIPEFVMLGEPAIVAGDGAAASPVTSRARVDGGVALSWFALVVIVGGVAALGLALITFGPWSRPVTSAVQLSPPSVTVVEFQNLMAAQPGAPKAAGLAIELVTDLDAFEELDVHYGGATGAAIAVSSDFVLTGIVRKDAALAQYSAILTDSRSGSVVWNSTIAVPASEAAQASVLDTVSRRLSLILGSPRGPLHGAARQLLAASPQLEGTASFYLCRMLFHAYRESGTAAAAGRADACMAGLAAPDQESPAGLAISAILLAEQDLGSATRDIVYAERLRLAQVRLDGAIALAPLSGFVWEQHARLREVRGQLDQARVDYGSALQLNPASGDALAGYARLLALRGNLAEAEGMARDAAERTPNPPDWYFGVPALLALQSGDYDGAIVAAERYARADTELGPILAILAGQRRGDGEMVNRYLAQILDVPSFRGRGVLPRLRERVQNPALLTEIQAGLTAAGVPLKAINGPF